LELSENENQRKNNRLNSSKATKHVYALSQSKDIKVKFEDLHQIFLKLIRKFQKEFQVVKIDKSIISSRIQADNVVYIILKYFYLDFMQYDLSKYQKDLNEVFKSLSKEWKKFNSAGYNYKAADKDNNKAESVKALSSKDLLNSELKAFNAESNNDRARSFGVENSNNISNYNDSSIFENINEEFIARRAWSQMIDLESNPKKFNLSLKLDSEGFFLKELIYKKKYECDILIMEILVFKNLIVTENISLSYPEEIITVCYIILLTITIFFKFSNVDLVKNSKKINFLKFTEVYKKYTEKIKEFKNYCFIHSIIFEIIKYLDLNESFEKEFLISLQQSNIIPSLNITMSFLQRDLTNNNNKNHNNNKSCIIDESYFEFSKFNKNRKSEVEKFFKGLDILGEFSLICFEHEINLHPEANIFEENLEIKNFNSLICRNVPKNSKCEFFIFVKDKSFNLFHPTFLLLFLIDKVIKNNSLTFFIDKFFEDAKDEEYFNNLLFYFKNYKLDIDMIFTD